MRSATMRLSRSRCCASNAPSAARGRLQPPAALGVVIRSCRFDRSHITLDRTRVAVWDKPQRFFLKGDSRLIINDKAWPAVSRAYESAEGDRKSLTRTLIEGQKAGQGHKAGQVRYR